MSTTQLLLAASCAGIASGLLGWALHLAALSRSLNNIIVELKKEAA